MSILYHIMVVNVDQILLPTNSERNKITLFFGGGGGRSLSETFIQRTTYHHHDLHDVKVERPTIMCHHNAFMNPKPKMSDVFGISPNGWQH